VRSGKFRLRRLARAGLVLALLAGPPAFGQPARPAPPAVGIAAATRQPVVQSSEYIGRIQATNRVNLVARVAAFLDQRLFTEGAEVRKGELLYRLEQAPFQADVQMREAAVAQFKAQLENAKLTLGRARSLLGTSAGQQSSVDTALAAHLAFEAQKHGAEALLEQARINLGYTEIRAPIDGKIGRTAVTEGNYVGPTTGVLVSIVSQDPMYVLFPISTRNVIQLRRRTAEKPGSIVIRLRLPDGKLYDKAGTLDFVDNTVSGNTDTMTLRGIVPNPPLPSAAGTLGSRELVDGELVTVILQDAQATEALTVPRAAVLTDQSGDYVFVVGAEDKVEQRRVQLGQSTPQAAVVMSGLTEGENVIVEGLQRARPGQAVSPAPASPPVAAPAAAPATAPATPAADVPAGGARPPRG
jgi:membrane fusion protein (multidrug efflux system)